MAQDVKQMLWCVIGGALGTLVLLMGFALYVWVRPYAYERVVNYGSVPAWTVLVEYELGGRHALVSLRMDGMRAWRDVAYTAESSEPWAPHWHGRLEGDHGEFVIFLEGVEASEPMTADLARGLARSYTVRLSGDRGEVTVDFRGAGFGTPVPFRSVWDEWLHRLCSRTGLLGG